MRSIKILFSLLAVVMLPVTSANAKTLLTVEEMREIKGKGCDPCGRTMTGCDTVCVTSWAPGVGWVSKSCEEGSSVKGYCSYEGSGTYCNEGGPPSYCTEKRTHSGAGCSTEGDDGGSNCTIPQAVTWSACP